MPRTPRRWLWTDAACYHVMNRGHNREAIFADDEDRRFFLGLLPRYRDRFDFRLYHYCLMGNHLHLLLQVPQSRRLSALMAGLLRSYVHHFHRRSGFVGHLFQGRFKSPAIEAEPYLLSCGRYLERNPVAAGLCARPWEYRWSSCRPYACGEADALLAANPWYEGLAAEAGQRQRHWRRFLEEDDPREAAVRQGDWAVGGFAFQARLPHAAGRPLPRQRGRPCKPTAAKA